MEAGRDLGVGREETQREGDKRAPAGRSRREWEGARRSRSEEQVEEETESTQRTERGVQKEEGEREKG